MVNNLEAVTEVTTVTSHLNPQQSLFAIYIVGLLVSLLIGPRCPITWSEDRC
jgi:hypothetical protein